MSGGFEQARLRRQIRRLCEEIALLRRSIQGLSEEGRGTAREAPTEAVSAASPCPVEIESSTAPRSHGEAPQTTTPAVERPPASPVRPRPLLIDLSKAPSAMEQRFAKPADDGPMVITCSEILF